MLFTFDRCQRRAIILLLLASIASILLIPIAANKSVPAVLDYINHFSGIVQAKIALDEGQFPLRVAPLDHDGWSYPYFQFYSPTTYTIAGFIYRWITPSSPFLAFKFSIWLGLIIAGLYMYRLAYWLVKSRVSALLTSVAYLTAPYFAIVINYIGAFSETLALCFIPIVLYYTLQQYEHPKKIATLLATAFAWYLLATTHILTFIFSSFFIGLFLLLLTFTNYTQWKNLIVVGVTYGFGCLLAIWHLAPIVIFSKYLTVNNTLNNFSFYDHTPTLANLLSPIADISSGRIGIHGIIDAITKIHPSVGLPILLAVGVCTYIFFRAKSETKTTHHYLFSLLILFFIAFLATWAPINVWHWLAPPFKIMQYSWRLLGQVIWIGSLLFALAISWGFNNKLSLKNSIMIMLAMLLCLSSWLSVHQNKTTDINNLIHSLRSSGSYLINATKHTQFMKVIDNMLLDSSTVHDNIILTKLKPLIFPSSLLASSNSPYLSIKGIVPKSTETKQIKINAFANGTLVASFSLQHGAYLWKIPLTSKPKANSTILLFTVTHQGKVLEKNKSPIIPIDEIILGGFPNYSKVLSVKEVQPHCQQEKINTLCEMNIPTNIHLVELPILYYPGALEITVNGKPAPYIGVFYQNRLIAATTPEAGQHNIIKMHFSGILWANYLSSAAWQLWLILLAYFALSRRHAL